MHDPMVVVFDLHAPVPMPTWTPKGSPRWGVRRRRFTGPAADGGGSPIDPWWRPRAWQLSLRGKRIGWWHVATVWHVEPGGADSGRVCKGMGSSELTAHNVAWAWRHRSHLKVNVEPWLRLYRWRTLRCAGCGLPFRWKGDARFGYQSSDDVYHDPCMSLRHVRGQLDDLTAYVRFEADDNARWRVEYRLKGLDEAVRPKAAT